MSRLDDQELTVRMLEQRATDDRARTVAAFRDAELPSRNWLVPAGTALNLAEAAPGLSAAAGIFTAKDPSHRRARLVRLILEAPVLLRLIRRVLPPPRKKS
ncbi:MAG: hypothetical protein JJU00_06695 [Opitutales bacterium]|nr:hypothetical protein [Opitutales bacterium]